MWGFTRQEREIPQLQKHTHFAQYQDVSSFIETKYTYATPAFVNSRLMRSLLSSREEACEGEDFPFHTQTHLHTPPYTSHLPISVPMLRESTL